MTPWLWTWPRGDGTLALDMAKWPRGVQTLMRQGRAHSVSKFVYPCESRDLQNGANNFQPAEL